MFRSLYSANIALRPLATISPAKLAAILSTAELLVVADALVVPEGTLALELLGGPAPEEAVPLAFWNCPV